MKDKLKALIVDDEKPARLELRFLLEEIFKDELKIVGEVDNGIEAVEMLKVLKPDIVFLDINMPDINGLDVAQIALEKNPNLKIIFITAFNQYAIKAFEINALDYLVKPIEYSRLKKTMARILNDKHAVVNYQKELKRLLEYFNNLITPKQRDNLTCEEKGKIILIKRDVIYYCTVENGKTYIGTKNKKIRTFYTLKELEENLNFFRANRSYLVNLDHIKHVEPMFHSSYLITLNDEFNTKIPVSRNKSKKLREILRL